MGHIEGSRRRISGPRQFFGIQRPSAIAYDRSRGGTRGPADRFPLGRRYQRPGGPWLLPLLFCSGHHPLSHPETSHPGWCVPATGGLGRFFCRDQAEIQKQPPPNEYQHKHKVGARNTIISRPDHDFLNGDRLLPSKCGVDLKVDHGDHFGARIRIHHKMLGGRSELKAHVHPRAVRRKKIAKIPRPGNSAAGDSMQHVKLACLAYGLIDPVLHLPRAGHGVHHGIGALRQIVGRRLSKCVRFELHFAK